MATDSGTRSRGSGRRGRPRQRSFGSTLGLTVLGALLPGSAFLAAGRRFVGFAVLTLLGIGVMLGVGVLLVEHDPAMLAAELASRPNLLLALGVALVVATLAWVVVIITGHFAVRPARAPGWQRGVGIVVTLVLCALVALPSIYGVRATYATYTLVTRVFDQDPIDVDGDGQVDDEVPPDREDPWSGRPRLNVLLLGGDAGVGRTGLRTDSVILASISTITGDTVLFSLPRNLQDVKFPPGSPMDDFYPNGVGSCGAECMLDAIYRKGTDHADSFPVGTKDPGVAAVRGAVSQTLGLDIDFFLMVDLGGFESLIDALGGIDINVGPDPIAMGGTDVNGNDQPESAIEEWVPAGEQHLNGRQALWFSRSRWHSDDYERMERQRCMLNAVVKQANPADLLANYLELAETAEDIISTDVPYQLFPAFLELANKVKSTPVRTLPFTDEVIPDRANPDFPEIRQLVQASLNPPPATAPPTTTTAPPTTTSPDPSTSVTPSVDPSAAIDADAVCG